MPGKCASNTFRLWLYFKFVGNHRVHLLTTFNFDPQPRPFFHSNRFRIPATYHGPLAGKRQQYGIRQEDECPDNYDMVTAETKEILPSQQDQQARVPYDNGTGSFQFFKLPLHVRRMIYRLLLGPIYQYSKSEMLSYTCLELRNPPWTFENRDDNGHKCFWQIVGTGPIPGYSLKPGLRVGVYGQSKVAHPHKYSIHPFRNSAYELVLYPERENLIPPGGYMYGDYTDRVYLEWLRRTASVSTHFRQELGEVFWTRAGISTSGADHSFSQDSMWRIPTFLADRPAVRS
ncbi:uncharacterized protein PAC_04661 [Phialocephala subalpina]|uniref:Uncharacterized protein n=1 Tax=Phialocephala subalpina TaxID=576137 RepID=A0A1L7WPS8_9HELO|nr:uncharacterized protein PAC_04661 [Phialocephala subalpina]